MTDLWLEAAIGPHSERSAAKRSLIFNSGMSASDYIRHSLRHDRTIGFGAWCKVATMIEMGSGTAVVRGNERQAAYLLS